MNTHIGQNTAKKIQNASPKFRPQLKDGKRNPE